MRPSLKVTTSPFLKRLKSIHTLLLISVFNVKLSLARGLNVFLWHRFMKSNHACIICPQPKPWLVTVNHRAIIQPTSCIIKMHIWPKPEKISLWQVTTTNQIPGIRQSYFLLIIKIAKLKVSTQKIESTIKVKHKYLQEYLVTIINTVILKIMRKIDLSFKKISWL